MSDGNSILSGRKGGIIVALVVGGSAVGVVGWYMSTNRAGPAIDASGFDLSTAPQSSRRAAPVASARPSEQPGSSLDMLHGDAGVRIGDTGSSGQAAAPAPAKDTDKKAAAHADFKEQAHKYEADVQRFAMKMTKKYPVIRQYGKDWMSHPDLKKLNDDYARNRDPLAFIVGLAKAPSLGAMVKKYAGSPEIIEFVTQGLKEAPADLTGSAMDVLSNDKVTKSLVANIANGIGLPPSVTGMISGGGDASKVDQKTIVSDMMNSPAMKEHAEQAPPPVSLSNQQ